MSAAVASASSLSSTVAGAVASVVVVLLTVGLPRLRIEEIGRGEATRLVTASLGFEAVVVRIATDGAVVDSLESVAEAGRRVGPNRLRIPEATGRRLLDGWLEVLLSTLSPCCG